MTNLQRTNVVLKGRARVTLAEADKGLRRADLVTRFNIGESKQGRGVPTVSTCEEPGLPLMLRGKSWFKFRSVYQQLALSNKLELFEGVVLYTLNSEKEVCTKISVWYLQDNVSSCKKCKPCVMYTKDHVQFMTCRHWIRYSSLQLGMFNFLAPP